ncbi:MAG: DUF4363 family protein [Clostridia bacterium]|nr:DUF4363 family protein [Clostridia bacterium]
MKIKILSIIILFAVISVSVVNSFILHREIDTITEKIRSLEINDGQTDAAVGKAEEIREYFRKKESYISLSVSHEDLSNIESILAEMIGQLEVGSCDDARVAKSRLIDALGHLKRLSGVNIDTIV